MEKLLEQIRIVNHIFEKRGAEKFSYEEICEILSDIMNSNTYIISVKGKVLGSYFTNEEDSSVVYEPETGMSLLQHENRALLQYEETHINIKKEEALAIFRNTLTKQAFKKPHAVTPIYGGGIRLGTLLFARYDQEFTIEDVILAEHVATVIGVEIERRRRKIREEDRRKVTAAQMAVDSLTCTEQKAVQDVFRELQTDTGLVVASKIADRANITRSIIVNALRKLESAGIIEARSYGAKGTRIRVLNDKFKEKIMKVC